MIDIPEYAYLNQIADRYEAVFCDIWGVIHNGQVPFFDAVDALKRYRELYGPVVLLTNAPVPAEQVINTMAQIGVEPECYDAVISSGDATRMELEKRSPGPVYRIGPDYDDPLYLGLAMEYTDHVEEAAFISCTGLREIPEAFLNKETHTDINPNLIPEIYSKELQELANRELELICANPDVVFRYGDHLIPSAGALANLYEDLGGRVIRPGKPGTSIYKLAYDHLEEMLGYKPSNDRILAIGDGPATDAVGAVREGLDFMFIGGGIHSHQFVEDSDFVEVVARLLQNENADAAYAAPALVW